MYHSFFFFKQKTAYEMRISDWSSDVCSSDLLILVDMLVKSYDAMPPGAAWMAPERLRDIAFFGSYAFAAGFLLALPVGFLLLCLNLIVGMLSRSAPALTLFAIGLPMSLGVGVIALAIAFPAMGDYMIDRKSTRLNSSP